MLKELHVQNFALIENLNLDFNDGFTVLTGETGSGKSIILGALNLIMGDRADFSVIRDSAKKTIVEAVFAVDQYDLKDFFTEHDLDFVDLTTIRREIASSGKSRAFINDTPVSLNVLKELTQNLIHIHSQHQTLGLKEEKFQLDLVDHLLDNFVLRDKISAHFHLWKKKQEAKKSLEIQYAEAKREEEFKGFQLEELQKLNLDTTDYQVLDSELSRLEKSEEIKTFLSEMGNSLSEDQNSIINQLRYIQQKLSKNSGLDPKFAEWTSRIDTLHIELKDLSYEVESYWNDFDINPNELQGLQEKRFNFQQALRKYHFDSQEELMGYWSELSSFSDNLEEIKEKIEIHRHEMDDLDRKIRELCILLHDKRAKGVSKISSNIEKLLAELKMNDTKVVFELSPLPHYNETGSDHILLTFSPNKGFTPKPVDKVASGGELSRLMLTIQLLLSDKKKLPSIIFDEIDTGVSGDVAEKIGKLLQKLGTNMQLLAITHLPQVAAKGKHHLKVLKKLESGKTVSEVLYLKEFEVVNEVARLMSGEFVTESAIQNAKALILN